MSPNEIDVQRINISPMLEVIMLWLNQQPIITALLALMVIDVVSGICVGIARKRISSTISWRGMSRKALMLLIVGVGMVLEPFAGGILTGKIVALFYLFTEAISILENAALAGVPLPKQLVDTLMKLKEDSTRDANKPAASTEVKVTVSPAAKTSETERRKS